jgi:hypothetical protein
MDTKYKRNLQNLHKARTTQRTTPKPKTSPLQVIRQKCLDCSGTTKTVKYCTCDGINSLKCPLWTYRFGIRPASAATKYGKQFVTPGELPDSNTNIEDLP